MRKLIPILLLIAALPMILVANNYFRGKTGEAPQKNVASSDASNDTFDRANKVTDQTSKPVARDKYQANVNKTQVKVDQQPSQSSVAQGERPAHVKGGTKAIARATEYPPAYHAGRRNVRVFLKFMIGVDGRASEISMDRIYGDWSHNNRWLEINEYRSAAIATVKRLEFIPQRTADNELVSSEMVLPIEFGIRPINALQPIGKSKDGNSKMEDGC